jgi:hypothetical protein
MSNRYRHLRITSAIHRRELGYSSLTMLPTLARPHRVRQPVCSEPVYCVTTPVPTGLSASPSGVVDVDRHLAQYSTDQHCTDHASSYGTLELDVLLSQLSTHV